MTTLNSNWIIQHSLVGTCPQNMHIMKGQRVPPFSIVFVCQTCGDAWASIRIHNSAENRDTKFYPEVRHCPEHGPGFLIPYDHAYMIPSSVLKRELIVSERYSHLDYDTYLLTGGL